MMDEGLDEQTRKSNGGGGLKQNLPAVPFAQRPLLRRRHMSNLHIFGWQEGVKNNGQEKKRNKNKTAHIAQKAIELEFEMS
jgi:hypothetical protein